MIAIMDMSETDRNRIAEALKHGNGKLIEAVINDIRTGHTVLLRQGHSSLTIMQEPDGIHINQMGGSKLDIPAILAGLSRIAKDCGKKYITLEGRKGWERMLSPYGFEKHGKRMRFIL